MPFISTQGGFQIGNNFEGELPQTGNTLQWADNFSKVVGNHSIKIGADVRQQFFDQFLYYNVNGDFSFLPNGAENSPGGINAYPDYFLGAPSSYSQGAAQGESLRNNSLYLFAQDSWKLRPNLTLNYGLRWELNTPYGDTHNRVQNFSSRPKHHAIPMLAFSDGSGHDQQYGWIQCSYSWRLRTKLRTKRIFPHRPRFSWRQRGASGADLYRLQGLCSKNRFSLQPELDRWIPRQAHWWAGQIFHPSRLRNLLQSYGTAGS